MVLPLYCGVVYTFLMEADDDLSTHAGRGDGNIRDMENDDWSNSAVADTAEDLKSCCR